MLAKLGLGSSHPPSRPDERPFSPRIPSALSYARLHGSAAREMAHLPAEEGKKALDLVGGLDPTRMQDLRVCAILDEFSERCFAPECALIQPRPDNWEAIVEWSHPDLLFVESAWKGNRGAWEYRVGHYQNPPGTELQALLGWFGRQGLPSVFWNKEDPVHTRKFLDTARRFDLVLTTDEGCVPMYQEALGHDRVAALPFAAQPRLHNPISTGQPREKRICFAGSFHSDRFEARQRELSMLLDAAIPLGLDIYDRNHGLAGSRDNAFAFPERFQPHVRGRLPYDQMIRAYQRYRVFLNVNSVVDSPTMFSRRVFELLASGTPVVSIKSRGIERLLGTDAVWFVETPEEAREALSTLLEDDEAWQRRSLAGIRRVFSGHTYQHRLASVLDLLGASFAFLKDPGVLLLAEASSAEQVEALRESFDRQTYPKKSLLVLCSPALKKAERAGEREDLRLVPHPGDEAGLLQEALAQRAPALCGVLSASCRYGEHYLEDLVHASTYSGAAIVGKALLAEGEYRYASVLHPAGCLFDLAAAPRYGWEPARALGLEPLSSLLGRGATSFAEGRHDFTPGDEG